VLFKCICFGWLNVQIVVLAGLNRTATLSLSPSLCDDNQRLQLILLKDQMQPQLPAASTFVTAKKIAAPKGSAKTRIEIKIPSRKGVEYRLSRTFSKPTGVTTVRAWAAGRYRQPSLSNLPVEQP
jgi:hypothetical protein